MLSPSSSAMSYSVINFPSCCLDLSPRFRFLELGMKILKLVVGIAGNILNGENWNRANHIQFKDMMLM